MIGFSSPGSQSLFKKLLLGNEPTPELLAILLVYFVQGVLSLARLAISFFLKDDLGLSPAQVAALTGVAALPWMIKPLWGFISDGLPILGDRRRPYLILSGLLGSLAWGLLATVVDSASAATAAIALSSLSVAISDVIADSLVVERARTETTSQVGSLQSLCWATSALGGLITAYLSGWLLEILTPQQVFGITALFPLIVALGAGLIAESPVTDYTPAWQTVKHQIGQLKEAILLPSIWKPTLFLFLWQATPSSDSAFFFFVTNDLGFEPEFLGRVRLFTSIAGLIGIWIFQRFLKAVPFRTIFGWSTVIAVLFGFTPVLLVTHTNRLLGIGDRWFSLGDSVILTVLGEIAFMPVLVLCAKLCPPGIEATLFALLMSITNLAHILSQELGAILMHSFGITPNTFDNLALLVTLTNLSSLLPLPFLKLLPSDNTLSTPQLAENSSHPLPNPEDDPEKTHSLLKV
ncbi:folate/biopterin family MFS transporter [Roseofilum capinflatum]|uniref:Folate/biopterin family MFS transporter n=1 Tax=Roseofilum capinflatum BLCC-M114 TaxID=3022440 RepID=A0ABT7BFF3_9CYAN|nr:folate/biopterin family MFS transporter [Roseofilum capinflatum]MDJ1177023.1 folate/biopterin family MFS transporter [Roseofilum capinflatum BLCC-M114]